MTSAEMIPAVILKKKAVVYVRQSVVVQIFRDGTTNGQRA